MNDDVSTANFIGNAINKGLVGIPTRKKKKDDGKGKGKGKSEDTTKEPEATEPTAPSEPVEPSKPSAPRTKTGKNATIKDVKAAISAGKIDQEQGINLSRGYANQFAKKEVGRQFRDYVGSYGGTSNQPPVNLTNLNTKNSSGNEIDEVTGPVNPKGNPTGKYVNPTGPIF